MKIVPDIISKHNLIKTVEFEAYTHIKGGKTVVFNIMNLMSKDYAFICALRRYGLSRE